MSRLIQANPTEVSRTTPRAKVSRVGWGMIAFLFVLGTINFADKAVIGFASVPMVNELHLSPVQWGLITGGFFWLFSLSSVLVGSWSDRVGTKRVLALLGATWALVQFATLFVVTFPFLLLSRVLLGAGEGPSYGVSLSAASKWLPPERRALGYAIMSLGSAIGPALFAPILIPIIVSYGWRVAFAILGVVGLIWVVLWWLLGRERPKEVRTSDFHEQGAEEKVSWSQLWPLLRSRNFIFSTLAGFGYFWWVVLLTNWYSLYLVEVRHFTMTNLTFIIGLPWLVSGLFMVLFGGLADVLFQRTKNSRRSHVAVVGPLMVVSALLLYGSVIIPSTIGAVILFTLIPAAVIVPLTATIIANVTPPGGRGAAQGIQVALATLAGIVASGVTGAIIQRAGSNAALGFQNAFLVGSIIMLVLGVAFWLFVHPDKHIATQATARPKK